MKFFALIAIILALLAVTTLAIDGQIPFTNSPHTSATSGADDSGSGTGTGGVDDGCHSGRADPENFCSGQAFFPSTTGNGNSKDF
ncbi:hypothetical protein CYY_003859 [Polysphondylium violaceum]|uniref:Uncharacterized protein n=1 Tax=Polysphondylium violaceum TaxID=133409 RepID=A0A8J4V0U0_9MYCE|nr:hypothetical protein CYY_003859 [Polysphondylium violaceum]